MASRSMTFWESLPEEELLAMHFTHPRQMEGSSRLQQHDNVHKQIAAFERLLQHSINKFSTDKLYSMLQTLINNATVIPPPKHSDTPASDSHLQSRSTSNVQEIIALSQIQQILADWKDTQSVPPAGIEKDRRSHVVAYFEAFFEDLRYLKTLKKYFDERVYMCLYDFFYDPEDDMLNTKDALDYHRKGHVTFDEEEENTQDGTGVDNNARELEQEARQERELELYFDRLMDDEKLSLSVKKMFQLNENWDSLLDQDVIDSQIFDPDSKHEILHYADYRQFQRILRLVPDIFVKAYKSVEAAKLWWTQSSKIQEKEPLRHSRQRRHLSEHDLDVAISELERQVTRLRDEIRTNEELLSRHLEELKNLRSRESRYLSLSQQCEVLEERKNSVGEKYNKLLQYRDQLRRKRDMMGADHGGLKTELEACQHSFMEAQNELRMLSYHFQLVQSDFLLELELRPELIRYEEDTNERIEEAKKTIWIKNEEVREQERRIQMLRTNCQRMKNVLRKCLASQSESERPAKDDNNRRLKKKLKDDSRRPKQQDDQRNNSNKKADDNTNNKQPRQQAKKAQGDRGKHNKQADNRNDQSRQHKSDKRQQEDAHHHDDQLDTQEDDGNEADTESPTLGMV